MLSPGKWHEQVPKDLTGNLEFRQRLLVACRSDKRAQAAIRHACKNDLIFFIQVFVWQFNQLRKKGGRQIGPWECWEYQEKILRAILWHIEEDEDLCLEKSREMGASWMMLLVCLWLWLFHRDQTFILMSRNEKMVDDKSSMSLFWKLDFVIEWLPGWLVPKMERNSCYLKNHDCNCEFIGESTTAQSTVGGRGACVILDEFSQIREADAVWTRTASTAGCRIFNFTHLGVDTAAYRLSRSEVSKLIIHWSEHPLKRPGLYRQNLSTRKLEILDKDYKFPDDYRFILDGTPTGGPFSGLRSPWYDKTCRRMADQRGVAMDLDINPEGASDQFFNPVTIWNLRQEIACEPYVECDLEYDKESAHGEKLVKRAGGRIKLWFYPDAEGKPPPADYAAGVDVAGGTGRTNSCLSIMNGCTGEKYLEYMDPNIEPAAFAVFCVALWRLFCDKAGRGAKACWEMQGPGLYFGKRVVELGYTNIYYNVDELSDRRMEIGNKPGWYPKPDHKRMMLEDYRAGLETRRYTNRSDYALKDCLKFKYAQDGSVVHGESLNKNDPSGAKSNHADIVIADGLSWKMGRTMLQHVQEAKKNTILLGSLEWRKAIHEMAGEEERLWA